jgi:hypothetical protein
MDGTPTNADVVIRSATDADAFPISFLLGDLGYPIEPALIVEKLAAHETSTASAWRSRAASSGTMRTAFHSAWVLSTLGSVRQGSGLIRVVRWCSQRSVGTSSHLARQHRQHRRAVSHRSALRQSSRAWSASRLESEPASWSEATGRNEMALPRSPVRSRRAPLV